MKEFAGEHSGPAARPIEFVGISKSFGRNQVLRDIRLTLVPGEVVGLMGPNGAGKSTLMKILAGLYRADAGYFEVGGERFASLAERPEVSFIHQDLGLIDDLSIADNLRLGQPGIRRFGFWLDRRAEAQMSEHALRAVALSVPVSTPVAELSPAEKTLVTIARAFARGATTLFVDEATSTLTRQDAARVVDSLRALAAGGALVVLITHKLSEIFDAADRVIILIDGQIVADEPITALDRQSLVRRLAAHGASHVADAAVAKPNPGAAVLTFGNVWGGKAGPVSFAVRAGEVVGLTGLPGSGLYDVAYLACGDLAPTAGRIDVAGRGRRALVPPHRETQGGFDALPVGLNMTISALTRWVSGGQLLSLSRERRDIDKTMDQLAVQPPDPSVDFATLSGGNRQKVIFGRAMLMEPDVYILCEPTRGVDVSTRAEIYRIIADLRSQGKAVLIVTSDAEDLIAVCDRVGVVENGAVEEPRALAESDPRQLQAFI